MPTIHGEAKVVLINIYSKSFRKVTTASIATIKEVMNPTANIGMSSTLKYFQLFSKSKPVAPIITGRAIRKENSDAVL